MAWNCVKFVEQIEHSLGLLSIQADGCLSRAVMGALQSERAGGMKFQEVQRIVAEIFAEPQRAEALKIANHLRPSLPQQGESTLERRIF
ncbi:MAG: hypothetical protein WC765_00750 [Phycisphaerae bacterium]|jgi:hypothetical protein